MNISILQINENKEKFLFYSYDRIKNEFDIHNYKVVWNGNFEDLNVTPSNNVTENLEMIFTIFNYNYPKDFKGHSLSTSDIVRLDDDYYYCDSCGWKKLDLEKLETTKEKIINTTCAYLIMNLKKYINFEDQEIAIGDLITDIRNDILVNNWKLK